MTTLSKPEKNIIIISGPAGSGKDTLINIALETLPLERVVTTTSRPKRDNEKEGREYYFLPKEEFEQKIANGEFLEHSQNENGAYYGVQKKHLEKLLTENKRILWKLDWKGMLTVKKIYPGTKSIAIMAEMETLDKRVRSREGNSYTENYFQERADYAKDYFTHMSDYDYIIWNEDDQLTESVEKFKSIVQEITSA